MNETGDAKGPAAEDQETPVSAQISSFQRVVLLMKNLYDFAAVHAILEDTGDGRWRNLCFSVVYGTEADFRSVPLELDEASSGRGSGSPARFGQTKCACRRTRVHKVSRFADKTGSMADQRMSSDSRDVRQRERHVKLNEGLETDTVCRQWSLR